MTHPTPSPSEAESPAEAPIEGNPSRLPALAFRLVIASALILLVGFVAWIMASVALYRELWPKFIPTVLSEQTRDAIRCSLFTTLTTTGLAVLVGAPAAYALSRYRVPLSGLVDTLIDLPIILPPLTAGICLLIAFQTPVGQFIEEHITSVVFTPKAIIVAQFFPTAGFCTRSLKAAIDSVDPRLENVARTLGCTEWGAFRRIVLPLARNGMLAGAVMTWARAMGIFGPIIMFCGTTEGKLQVLPITVYLNMSTNRLEEGMCVALIMVAIAVVVLLAFRRLGGRGYLW
jgi:molybdate transport system permease protein